MSTLKDRLKELIDGPPKTRITDLAKAVGCSRATLYGVLKEETGKLYGDLPDKIADYFNVNETWFTRGKGDKYAISDKKLPEKPQEKSQESRQKSDTNRLEKTYTPSKLGNANTETISDKEERMSLNLLKQMYQIEDANLIHGLALITNLPNAIDKDRQILDAVQLMLLSVKRMDVDLVIKPHHQNAEDESVQPELHPATLPKS